MRRVVVTGMGVVSPFGQGKEVFWEAMKAGKSGIRRLQNTDTADLDVTIGGEVPNFQIEPYIPPREARQMDLFCRYGVWAAYEAVEDAGLQVQDLDPYRVGVIIGSGIGGLAIYESQAQVLFERGPRRVSPLFIPKVIINIVSGWIGILMGIKGFTNSTVTACSTGLTAIGEAFWAIQLGVADVVIAGGTEAPLTRMGISGFSQMRALARNYNDQPEKASRPFDAKREGFVMSEGAGILVLEELEHAERRGARIYAEVLSFAMTGDAHHITAPDPCGQGAAEAMRQCLQMARVAPEEVEYINAHGTSTPLNDKMETLAIKQVFGDYAYKIPVSSTKSMHGHLLGAAGGVESVATILALHEGIIPPTINYENPDPECDLDYVPNKARKQDIRIAMCNSFAFGGHNAIVLFKKYEG